MQALPWMDDDARRDAIEDLQRAAGRDPDAVRGNVESVSEDDFRREIGAPPKPVEKTSG